MKILTITGRRNGRQTRCFFEQTTEKSKFVNFKNGAKEKRKKTNPVSRE